MYSAGHKAQVRRGREPIRGPRARGRGGRPSADRAQAGRGREEQAVLANADVHGQWPINVPRGRGAPAYRPWMERLCTVTCPHRQVLPAALPWMERLCTVNRVRAHFPFVHSS